MGGKRLPPRGTQGFQTPKRRRGAKGMKAQPPPGSDKKRASGARGPLGIPPGTPAPRLPRVPAGPGKPVRLTDPADVLLYPRRSWAARLYPPGAEAPGGVRRARLDVARNATYACAGGRPYFGVCNAKRAEYSSVLPVPVRRYLFRARGPTVGPGRGDERPVRRPPSRR